MNAENEYRHLTLEELATRLGIAVQTLYQWRSQGKGPRGMKIGRHVRFRVQDVVAWEEAQLEADDDRDERRREIIESRLPR
ncbi:helix-turn-helix transcriptional regulator [Arthrobacter sp.]|uniref:helix-turn-helix transcriptional regulator n=1 Tax=Arthrobacter sp. TaxID=1667 RepID=UPI003A8F924E